jgi:uncharacterized protein (DUF2267 family)
MPRYADESRSRDRDFYEPARLGREDWDDADGRAWREEREARGERARQGRGNARSGLAVFDKTLQTTHIWLNEIADQLGPDRQHAWKVLSVVLHKLRDRLPLGVSAHLGAQLPLLIRGVYYDQFQPARQPTDCDLDEFIDEVDEWLADARPTDPRDAIAAVFQVLSRHIPAGAIAKVQDSLPRRLRAFWFDAEEAVTPPPRRRGREARMQ